MVTFIGKWLFKIIFVQRSKLDVYKRQSSESCKEEDSHQASNPVLDKVKEEPGGLIKREPQEEETEVCCP